MAFTDNEAIMWADGELVPAGDARIAALDHAITVGDGLFEATKVVHGQVWALRRHLDRMERSAAKLGFPPIDRAAIEHAVAAGLAANAELLAPDTHDVIRITLTGGNGPIGSGRPDHIRPRLLVAITHHTAPPETAKAITVPWARNEKGALAGVKSLSYAENALALDRARAAGAHEAIFPNTAGNLCEGTRSNVFVVTGGRLLTPPLADGPLAGVTRELVLEWTDATEETMPLAVLETADEVFITSTGNDVTAITEVDGRPVGAGVIGPKTRAAQRAWAEGQARGLNP
jgi:branched-chain amino acid aminotransferase